MLLGFLLCFPAGAQVAATLMVDRGLPTANLNDVAGANRSNNRLARDSTNEGFFGDDFTIGDAGQVYVIDSIRTWAVAIERPGRGEQLGDRYEDIRLYFGIDNVSEIATGTLMAGCSHPDNPNINVSAVSYPVADASGNSLFDNIDPGVSNFQIWQIDFTTLKLVVNGGVAHRFGVWGKGRLRPGEVALYFPWFNHASNAARSGSPQQGADNRILSFLADGTFERVLNTKFAGWDKPADLNVQVFAYRVPVVKSDCKKGGWKSLFTFDARSFVSQSDCVTYLKR